MYNFITTELIQYLLPFAIMFNAIMLLVLEYLDSKRRKEEEKLKEFQEKHTQIKERWKKIQDAD